MKPHGMAGEAIEATSLMPEKPFVALTKVAVAQGSEENDNYPGVVVVLNPALRIIRSRCDLQWILQRKNRPTRWSSIAFCGTKQGLLMRIKEHLQGPDKISPLAVLLQRDCDLTAWAAIEALPDYYPKRASVLGRKRLCRFYRDPMRAMAANGS
jgi:hypothetical protein